MVRVRTIAGWVVAMVIAMFVFSFLFYPSFRNRITNNFSGLSGFFSTSKQDVILNPEEYEGEEVTIEAIPHPSRPGIIENPYNPYSIGTEDKEGKRVSLWVKYGNFHCQECKITGTIETVEVCGCIELSYRSNGEYERDFGSRAHTKPVKKCEEHGRSAHLGPDDGYLYIAECEPNSTRKKYYLDVTDVVALD